ncbi:MAG: hypothetical protein ACOYOT_10420 [Bacteroidales bacterium]
MRATGFDTVCWSLLPMAITLHQYLVLDFNPRSVYSDLVEALLTHTLSAVRGSAVC